ncbi:hypothetical protein BsWGS_02894 [Bradybaena similaris]
MDAAEILDEEYRNVTFLDNNDTDTSTESPDIWYSQSSLVYRTHQFHYIHVFLPFLVALFLTLYILGLIWHYRNVVLIREHHEKRGNALSSSGTSLVDDEDNKNQRTKWKTQGSTPEAKRFTSNITIIEDAIQT